MTATIFIALAAWLLLSLPIGMLTGRLLFRRANSPDYRAPHAFGESGKRPI